MKRYLGFVTLRLLIVATSCTLAASPLHAEEPEKEAKKSSITVSKETTYFTEPLTEDGYVDYVAALNAQLSAGVTPENNAAVLLWQARGPAEIDAKLRERFFKALGMAPLPEEGNYFKSFRDFAPDDIDALDEASVIAANRPWKANEFPELARWLKANEKPLALVTAGSKRPKFYELAAAAHDKTPMLLLVMLPHATSLRDLARALCLRATLHVGEGNFNAAGADLMAVHRLARLIASGPTLIQALVGLVLDDLAFNVERIIALEGKFTAEQFQTLRKAVAAQPPISRLHEKVNFGERLAYLDVVARFSRDDESVAKSGAAIGMSPEILKLMIGDIDWDEPLRMGNAWHDQLAAAARRPTFSEQKVALEEFDAELKTLAENFKGGKRMAALALTWGPARKKLLGRIMGEYLRLLMSQAIKTALQAEHRHQMNLQLTQVSLALAAFRAEHGKYPEMLGLLAPKYLPELPPDLYTEKPLTYRTEGEGYILYSFGENETDDGGIGYDDEEADGDDLVIRSSKK